jgi:TM2 domain-containing membrane protein YozV
MTNDRVLDVEQGIVRHRRLAWMRIVLGLALIVGGFVTFGVAQSHVDWLSAHGRRTSAVVIGTDPNCGSEDAPHVDVAFSLFPGARVTDNLATGETGCSGFHVGQKLWIYVNPADPSDAELSGGNADIGTPGWIGFGLILTGIGFCWNGWRQLLRAHRALVDSRLEIAETVPVEVTEVQPLLPADRMIAQAGWSVDPWGVAPLRWWDGVRWTGHTTSVPPGGWQPEVQQYGPGPTGPITVTSSAPQRPAQRSRRTAGLLAIFLGWLGVHRFYLGFTGIGLLMLLLTVLSAGLLGPLIAIWGIVEGILIFRGARSYSHDAHGLALRPHQPDQAPVDSGGPPTHEQQPHDDHDRSEHRLR